MRREACALAALALFASREARAEEPLRVEARCERLAAPGRARCDVTARAPDGAKLSWADVEILEVPPFAVPLKGRIGPRDATAKGDEAYAWSFALVAREKGAGDVAIRVRAVICRGDACAPREQRAAAKLEVGPK